MTSPWIGLSQNSWDAVASDADRAMNQVAEITLQDEDYHLSFKNQCRNRHLRFFGTLTNDRAIYLMSQKMRRISIENHTDGGFSLTVLYPEVSGPGTREHKEKLVIPNGEAVDCQGDGWNVVSVPSGLSGAGISQVKGILTLPAGVLSGTIDDPSITAESFPSVSAMNAAASHNDLHFDVEPGRVTYYSRARADGFGIIQRQNFVMNMVKDTPQKVIDYTLQSGNDRVVMDPVNGFLIPQYNGQYNIVADFTFDPPQNSNWVIYLARNEDLSDSLSTPITLEQATNAITVWFSPVVAGYQAGDNVSLWVERTDGQGIVEVLKSHMKAIQQEVDEDMPPLSLCTYRYMIT